MEFNKEYTEYWIKAVTKSVDGIKIPGGEQVNHFLSLVDIKYQENILDLGCGTGRLFDTLNTYSNRIYGVDPDSYAVRKAKSKAYTEIKIGSVENISYKNNYFDNIFCCGVFDVVDHYKGLKEINRVMKEDGKLLLTGKNNNYDKDDELAFKAEKNAFLKSFPNKFSNLKYIVQNINNLGFNLEHIFIFKKRGDFGAMKYTECGSEDIDKIIFYDYLIILKKIGPFCSIWEPNVPLHSKTSLTADKLALDKNHKTAKDLFLSIGID